MKPLANVLTTLAAGLVLAAAPSPASLQHSDANDRHSESEAKDLKSIEHLIEELYLAYCFDPGEPFDAKRFDEFFMSDAIFVQPVASSSSRKIDSLAKFYADFENFIESLRAQQQGIYEDILNTRSDVYGDIAHSYVVFQPRNDDSGVAPSTRGMDSYQLVKVGESWRIASMTTQFESQDLPMPERFLH